MTGFGDLVKNAFYLGVGAASMAAEQANASLQELRGQAQKLAEEMVQRGEMTTEEARQFVNDMMQQAQAKAVTEQVPDAPQEPRRIEILDDEEGIAPAPPEPDQLRDRVRALQEELERLKRQQ